MKRQITRLCGLVLLAGFIFTHPSPVGAIALTSPSDPNLPSGFPPPANLIQNPNDFFSFDGPVITWKMNADFITFFADSVLQDQVRLAIKEWERASSSPSRRDPLAPYAFSRWTGQRNFLDLRSIITHEVGHALGSQHTDASWFNNNLMLNFRPDGMGGLVAAPPLGGEVMNEGGLQGFLPNQKPPKGLNGGEYWHLVSKDELAMLDYAYGQPLTFQEVGTFDDADLTIGMFNIGGPPSGTAGIGSPDTSQFRVPADPKQGARILTASAKVSANTNTPIGMQARKSSWEYTNNTGEGVKLLNIQVEGTDNRNALATTSIGANRFNTYEPSFISPQFEFERTIQIFKDPVGGAVPNGSTVQVGLRMDVWDWFVTSAHVQTISDNVLPANLVSILPWNNPDLAGLFLPPLNPSGLTAIRAPLDVPAAGFRLINGETPTAITEIAFAVVKGLGLELKDLTSETKDALAQSGLLQTISFGVNGDALELGPFEEFIVVLKGGLEDLPAELLETGNFIILAIPGDASVLNDELFAYTRSVGADHSVGAFSLLNSDPIVGRDPGSCGGLFPTILGTSGDDIIRGTAGNDVINGLGGNDAIFGGDGNDVICGGAGSDKLSGGDGDDRIFGGDGNDGLNGGSGDDMLDGGSGRNKLNGRGGIDECVNGRFFRSCEL